MITVHKSKEERIEHKQKKYLLYSRFIWLWIFKVNYPRSSNAFKYTYNANISLVISTTFSRVPFPDVLHPAVLIGSYICSVVPDLYGIKFQIFTFSVIFLLDTNLLKGSCLNTELCQLRNDLLGRQGRPGSCILLLLFCFKSQKQFIITLIKYQWRCRGSNPHSETPLSLIHISINYSPSTIHCRRHKEKHELRQLCIKSH